MTSFQEILSPPLFSSFFLFIFITFIFRKTGISSTTKEPLILAAFITVVWIVGVISIYLNNLMSFKKHNKDIAKYANKHGLKFKNQPNMSVPDEFVHASILKTHDVREPSSINVVNGPDWIYTDLDYKVYSKTKNGGEYHSADVYYAAMSIKLPRELPNVIFDSLTARKRQFQLEFDDKQQLTMEGNFNQYFMAYCPDGYSIDTLSFITPDVMETLIMAKDYDIEIVKNRLYLYTSLGDPSIQIDDMVTKIHAIEKELLDNILTYRDARLSADIGRNFVAVKGAHLKTSGAWIRKYLLVILIFIVLLGIFIIMGMNL